MPKDLAIVLNNGSVNSAIITSLAAQRFRPIMLNFVGDPAVASRLSTAFEQQVAHYKPYRHHTLAMPHLALMHESATPQPPPDPRAPIAVGAAAGRTVADDRDGPRDSRSTTRPYPSSPACASAALGPPRRTIWRPRQNTCRSGKR